jgi:DNA-directed RNA polymerase specialized sigma24 family protein
LKEAPSLTALIHRAAKGDAEAADELFAATSSDLRKLALARLRPGGRNTLLDTSSLVHESFLRFAGAGQLRLQDRIHFMRWAGRVMRSLIVDFARRRQADRRGANVARHSRGCSAFAC